MDKCKGGHTIKDNDEEMQHCLVCGEQLFNLEAPAKSTPPVESLDSMVEEFYRRPTPENKFKLLALIQTSNRAVLADLNSIARERLENDSTYTLDAWIEDTDEYINRVYKKG